MEFFKKILNKLRNLFKKQKLLTNGGSNCIDDLDTDTRTKEEFFRIYKAYQAGKIKKEHLLITDLIDIELMMMEEEALLDNNIINEQENIEKQNIEIKTLLNKKIELEKKV